MEIYIWLFVCEMVPQNGKLFYFALIKIQNPNKGSVLSYPQLVRHDLKYYVLLGGHTYKRSSENWKLPKKYVNNDKRFKYCHIKNIQKHHNL